MRNLSRHLAALARAAAVQVAQSPHALRVARALPGATPAGASVGAGAAGGNQRGEGSGKEAEGGVELEMEVEAVGMEVRGWQGWARGSSGHGGERRRGTS